MLLAGKAPPLFRKTRPYPTPRMLVVGADLSGWQEIYPIKDSVRQDASPILKDPPLRRYLWRIKKGADLCVRLFFVCY